MANPGRTSSPRTSLGCTSTSSPKPGKDAFYATDLDEYLMRRKISGLVITGVTTEVCVQTTMRCANDRGYDCLLVEDGTDSYFPEFKEVTLRALVAQGGIVGWTCKSDALLHVLAKERAADVTRVFGQALLALLEMVPATVTLRLLPRGHDQPPRLAVAGGWHGARE